MRHAAVEEWSRNHSPVHDRDARVKLIALTSVLIAAGATDRLSALPSLELLLLAGVMVSGIPLHSFLLRLFAILPVPAVFAGMTALSGDSGRATLLFCRAVVSVTAILLAVSTTPLAAILAALGWFRMPAMLVETLQFVYRYLFVLIEEVFTVRAAAAARGGSGSLLAAAAGAGVLFARSYSRAEAIHRSMLARGLTAGAPLPKHWSLTSSDFVLLGIVLFAVTTSLFAGWTF